MSTPDTSILVHADWSELSGPHLVGTLRYAFLRGKPVFHFEYDKNWLSNPQRVWLDPDLQLTGGPLFPSRKSQFGAFSDSMPDTWGRTLMKRREALSAINENRPRRNLTEVDFLLGVNDLARMGGLRFKTTLNGPFLAHEARFAVPVWSRWRALQAAAEQAEAEESSPDASWLELLFAPGSSLGGARPKASILDENGDLWIAKFPSKNDRIDKGLWEFLVHKLAVRAGISMSPCVVERFNHQHHTFFTKRFDREAGARRHFLSAMTMLGKSEEQLRTEDASYLELAETVQFVCTQPEKNLEELWRRLAFSVCVSNTDDHLRNHGFLLRKSGWHLSPAFDLNPDPQKNGLSLNIDESSNVLSLDVVKATAVFYRLNTVQMHRILEDVTTAVSTWETLADELGIRRSEQEEMRSAFRVK
jgi:serine/threonine-protein kinase HipA